MVRLDCGCHVPRTHPVWWVFGSGDGYCTLDHYLTLNLIGA